jgi:hypothetical protein
MTARDAASVNTSGVIYLILLYSVVGPLATSMRRSMIPTIANALLLVVISDPFSKNDPTRLRTTLFRCAWSFHLKWRFFLTRCRMGRNVRLWNSFGS